MYRDELKELISFVDKSNELFNFDEEAISQNSIWDIYSYLFKSHLDNKLVTLSSLADYCRLPRATAIRKINSLINKSIILQRPRTKTGKTYSLHPSEKLLQSFENYLKEIKYHVAFSLGYENKNNNNFYFGTSFFSANIIPPPGILNINCNPNEKIKMLLGDDPTFIVINKNKKFIENMLGVKLEISLMNNNSLREELIKNSKLRVSKYDIISYDMPWTGEIHKNKYLLPLNEIIHTNNFNIKDFHPAAIKASTYNNNLYGLPIEEVASIMVYRKDIFDSLGLKIPKNITELFFCLKKLEKFSPTKYSFAWPGVSGFPFGCHFMEMMGNLGSPLIKLREISKGIFDTSNLDTTPNVIDLTSDASINSIYLLSKIKQYSHPNILSMTWDDVAKSYTKGDVAVANIWSGRSGFFENNKESPAYKNSVYTAKPGGKEGFEASSIGGFSLGIPININSNKVKIIFSIIKYLVSPPMIKYYIENGVTASPLFSVSNDPEVQKSNPSLISIDNMQKKGLIKNWLRVPIPNYFNIANLIGNVLHTNLKNRSNTINKAESLKIAQSIQSSLKDLLSI